MFWAMWLVAAMFLRNITNIVTGRLHGVNGFAKGHRLPDAGVTGFQL